MGFNITEDCPPEREKALRMMENMMGGHLYEYTNRSGRVVRFKWSGCYKRDKGFGVFVVVSKWALLSELISLIGYGRFEELEVGNV